MPGRNGRIRGAGILVAAVMAATSLAGGIARADVTVENGTVSSFDGTTIAYTLFLPAGASEEARVPIVLMTHGWGGSRVTDPTNARVKMLTDAGYAVLTWDQRGFGVSGGEANVDSQEFEVRDVQALIDLAASVPAVLTDDQDTTEVVTVEVPCPEPSESPTPEPSPTASPEPEPEPEKCFEDVTIVHEARDPRMGMLGGSYAGGIQLMTAAADERVDAIVPEIAWHDLPQSLKPNGVLKLGWDLLLYGAGLASAASAGLPAGQTGAYNAHIHQSLVEGMALNDWSTTTYDWFDAKSPKHYIGGASLPGGRELPGISAPTLLIQGVSDTLFPVNEALGNYEAIRARGVPAKMIWFCGGHTITPLGTSCVRGADQGAVLNARIMAWLDRYVKGDVAVETGPALEYQLQDGSWHALETLPGDTIDIFASTKVTNYVVPTSGQVTAGTPAGCRSNVSRTECPTPPQAEWIPVGTYTGPPPKGCVTEPDPEHPEKPLCEPTLQHLAPGTKIVGTTKLRVSVTAAAPESYVFFKLIAFDTATKKGVVIDDQVTALKATWPGLGIPKVYELDMAGVAWEVKPGQEIYLEVAPNSNDHASSRFPGSTSLLVDASVPVILPPPPPSA